MIEPKPIMISELREKNCIIWEYVNKDPPQLRSRNVDLWVVKEIASSERYAVKKFLSIVGSNDSRKPPPIPLLWSAWDFTDTKMDFIDRFLDLPFHPRHFFRGNTPCRRIDGFCGFHLLSRIIIPSSVEIISSSAFPRCGSLTVVIFESGSHLTQIQGFWKYTSLSRITIPSSIKLIHSDAFSNCRSLIQVLFEKPS